MATYNDIKTLFYEIVGDNESAPYVFSSADVSEFASMALRDMSQRTGFHEAGSIIMLRADQAEYSMLPLRIETVFRVTYDFKRILPITKRRLRRYDPRWREKSGRPIVYYLDESQNMIGFYKKPDADSTRSSTSSAVGWITDTSGATRPATGGGMLTDLLGTAPHAASGGDALRAESGYVEVFGTLRPDAMVPAHPLDLPSWAWIGILYGALSRACEADTKMRDLNAAAYYKMLYDRVVHRLKIRTNGKLPRTWVMEGFGSERRSLGAVTRLPQHIEES